jgi:cytochrome P450
MSREPRRLHLPTIAKYTDGLPRLAVVIQWASFRSEANFRDEGLFVPERWLEDDDDDDDDGSHHRGGRYADDAREVHQPFGVGPRNCLGRAMAMHEMRLVFASLVYHFDLAFADETRLHWPDQRTHVVWDKRPLLVRATRVRA